MNSLDAVFLECEQSHFFERFGSFVTAKMSNKGEEFAQSKGGTTRGVFRERQCNDSLG